MQHPTEKDYFDAVSDTAREVVDAARRFHPVLIRDAAFDLASEYTEASPWTFEHYTARFTLLYSDNEDAIFDLGSAKEVFSKEESMLSIYCRAAFQAMWTDVCTKVEEILASEGV